jgi:hypothetical protein
MLQGELEGRREMREKNREENIQEFSLTKHCSGYTVVLYGDGNYVWVDNVRTFSVNNIAYNISATIYYVVKYVKENGRG